MIAQGIKKSLVASKPGLFQLDRENNILTIELPQASGEASPDEMRTFFGMLVLHCMALIYIDNELYGLHNETAYQKLDKKALDGISNIEQHIMLRSEQKGQRQKEILGCFKNPSRFLESNYSDFESSAKQIRYNIGDLTLVDKVNDPRLYILDKNKSKMNSITRLYWSILAADSPGFQPHEESMHLSDGLLAAQKFSEYFSSDSDASPDYIRYFNVNKGQLDNIKSRVEKISVEKSEVLSPLSTAIIKNTYKNFPHGGKYAACVAEKQRKKEHFKDTLDALIKKHITMLKEEKQTLKNTVKRCEEKSEQLNNKKYACVLFWLHVLFRNSPDKLKSKAMNKANRTAYELKFVCLFAQKLEEEKSCNVESVLNQVQKENPENDQHLFAKNRVQAWAYNMIYNGSGTVGFFVKVRTMYMKHVNVQEKIKERMQQIERSATTVQAV